MPRVHFSGKDYTCPDDAPLLDSLLRQGARLPFSCKGGACQSCLCKATKGKPTATSQTGLKNTLIAQSYFLPCVCKPNEDMEIMLADSFPSYQSQVLEKKVLNNDIMRLRLTKPDGFTYHAGQFINIQHNTKQAIRSYSLASLMQEDFLELHVKRITNGQLSSWLCDDIEEGETITFTGAAGDCFYLSDKQEIPLMFAATGTGLAPIYGIVRDALLAGHQGDIQVYHASLNSGGLYYQQEMLALDEKYPHMTYIPCVLNGQAPENGKQGSIEQLIVEDLAAEQLIRAYLCGNEPIVTAMKVALINHGLSMRSIYADAFTITAQPQ